ncbi:MAG: two-component system LytT family response regulator [Saprospiraceae bacterium]|jgi:two-component system LytT family response regulator
MTKLKTVIIEDEDKSLVVLKYLIERHLDQQVEIIETFNDPLKAKDYLESHTVDLIFLDIQMPRMNGFELLDSLSKIEFDLIFTTAFNNYATKAFRYFAIDYYMKASYCRRTY